MSMPPVAQDKINTYGLDAVCDDILNGLTLRTIAKNLRVDIASLCKWKAQPQHWARVTDALAATAEYWDQVAVGIGLRFVRKRLRSTRRSTRVDLSQPNSWPQLPLEGFAHLLAHPIAANPSGGCADTENQF